MDIIDNLLYATVNSPLQPPPAKIISKFISPFTTLSGPINKGEGDAPVFEYPLDQKINLCSYQDPEVLETAIQRHWYDVMLRQLDTFPYIRLLVEIEQHLAF